MGYFIEGYFRSVSDSLHTVNPEIVHGLTEEMVRVWKRGGAIYVMGNGGSAATASHMVCDLVKLTISEGRRRIKAVALTDNMPVLTAWANDTCYDRVFAEQLVPFLEKKDLVLAISGSGNSPNVVQAIHYAQSVGAKTASLSGFNGGRVSQMTDYPVVTYSDSMQVVEDSHSLLCHGMALDLCRLLDSEEREARLQEAKGV